MYRIYGVGDTQSLRIWIYFLTDAYFVDDEPVISINFGRNPDIKSMHLTNISMEGKRDSHFNMAELEWLMHFLSDIGESSRVEEIKLDVFIGDETVDWSPWERVDHILAETSFQSLRKVDIGISGLSLGLSEFCMNCRRLAAKLPLLQASGILGQFY